MLLRVKLAKRQCLAPEALLYQAGRAQHVENLHSPRIEC